MGYETRLIFISAGSKKKTVGYCSKVAELELSKVAYNNIGKLIEQKRHDSDELRKEIGQQIKEIKIMHSDLFGADGDYTEEAKSMTPKDRDLAIKKMYDLKSKVEKKIPYIYIGEDEQGYEDSYGDLLLVATLQELKSALVHDNALAVVGKDREDSLGDSHFILAIKMIEEFENTKKWHGIKVVLYGH